MVDCSIVICTYKRQQAFSETLASISRHWDSWRQKRSVELVLIINNSPDDSEAIARAFGEQHPDVYTHVERKQGLSNARNAGVQEARGTIIAFLDDDIELEEDWLLATLKPFEDARQVGAVGGKVLPFGQSAFPNWLPLQYGYLASVFCPGEEPLEVKKVMGANFAVRSSVFKEVGVFDPSLGRKGDLLLGGEEIDLLERIHAKGHSIRYEPNSVVFHKIGPKLNHEYILSYAKSLGYSEASMEFKSAKAKFIAKFCRSLIFPTLVHSWRQHFGGTPSVRFRARIEAQYAHGYAGFLLSPKGAT